MSAGKKSPYPVHQAAAYPTQQHAYVAPHQPVGGAQPAYTYAPHVQQYPGYAPAMGGANYQAQPPPPYNNPPPPYYAAAGQMQYAVAAPVVVSAGAFDAGARFGVGSSLNVPPPPPGYAPTAAQMAAAYGQPVVMGQNSHVSNGGVSFGF